MYRPDDKCMRNCDYSLRLSKPPVRINFDNDINTRYVVSHLEV